jgi:hypothetical protein
MVSSGASTINAAALQLLGILRLEEHVPAVDRHVAECGLDLVDIVSDAGRAPHIVDGILVVGIVVGEALHYLGPHVLQVRQLGFVKLLEDTGLDLACQERPSRYHDVVTRAASQQLGLKQVVGIEDVVDDLDAGLLGEVGENGIVDVIGPVVDVDNFVLRQCNARGKERSRHHDSQSK